MKNYSVFDIIGPRMTGPSSSHTAGAVRLAHVARHIAHYDITEAKFTLYGSFAETGKGHGTDKALIAGVLGMQTDDPNIRKAYRIAREQGIQISMNFSDETPEQPNTVRIEILSSDGSKNEMVGVSVGGGNILVTEINGMEVEITGEYPTIVVQHHDEPGAISEITHVLAQLRINIAFMRVFRQSKGEDAYMTIETDDKVTDETLHLIQRLCPNIRRLFAV